MEESQWKSSKGGKLTIQLTIIELQGQGGEPITNSLIAVSQGRSTSLGGLVVGAPSILSLDLAAEPFLEVRIDDKDKKEREKKKKTKTFRINLAEVKKGFVGEERRVLACGYKVAFVWTPSADSPWSLPETFSSWLRGSYSHLFAEDPASSHLFAPQKGAERVLLNRANVLLKNGGDGIRGSLILTSLRLVFIPGFVDIQALVAKTLGGESERSVSEVAATFSSQRDEWTLEHLTKYFKEVDTDGDGMVSAEEMATFLVSSTSSQSQAGESSGGFGIPLAQISEVKLPAKSSKLAGEGGGGGGADDDDDNQVLVFNEGDLSATVVSFARVSNSSTSGATGRLMFGQHTVYHMEVSVGSESWVVGKRYSEFAHLRDRLLVEGTAASSLPILPPKQPLTSMVEPERRRVGLDGFLQAALSLPAARTATLAEFLGAASVLKGLKDQDRDEEDEEEKTALESPSRKLALHILAETNQALAADSASYAKQGSQALRVVSKTGFSGVFIVVNEGSSSSFDQSSSTSSQQQQTTGGADWCAALVSEIHFLQAQAEFPTVFVSATSEEGGGGGMPDTAPLSSTSKSSLSVTAAAADADSFPTLPPLPPALPSPLSPALLRSSSSSSTSPFLSGRALMEAEYERFGLLSKVDGDPQAMQRWRIVDNSSFSVCETYPATFAVPAAADDTILAESAKQRSKSRVPALTWLHPETGTALCRSSQPLAGLKGVNEHKLKWEMLMAIRDSGVPGACLKVVDARPKLNAQANAIAGKGFEDVEAMPGKRAAIEFMNIENIHAMRSSLALLTAASASQEDDFPELLAASKWLLHVKMVLRGGLITADALDRKQPVLVHCSDGWDRTSQLSALAQLLLDPFYRTLVGFARLVEKDFCSFGHMCARRSDPNTSEYSPVLLQFFDATYQVLRQFPTAFEFTEAFLLACVDGFTSGWSLSFAADCERDRDASKAFTGNSAAPSLWQLLLDGKSISDSASSSPFRNPAYVAPEGRVHLLRPNVAMQAVVFWSALYLRNSPLLD